MSKETETPPETLAAATEKDALPSGQLALLGTFLKPEGAKALVRTASGKIETVTKGTSLGNAQVVAIEYGTLVIARGNRATTLRMPEE